MAQRIHPITMPKWGIEMQEGTITTWNIAPGEAIGKGENLLEVETEKIVNSVEAPIAGTLRRIVAQPGEVHKVGALIGVFATADVGDAEIDQFVASFKGADASFEPQPSQAASPPPAPPSTPVAAPAISTSTTSADDGAEARVSPIARRLAEQLGVDLTKVRGTGRNGRISKEDVEAYAAANAPGPAAAPSSGTGTANATTREKLSSMRATIAKRLVESKQTIPHYRLAADVDASALLARRAALANAGTRVSVNDLIVRACGLALVQHPAVNAQLTGDEVVRYADADIALAVATDNGLITPILRAVNRKTLAEIATQSAALAERARAGKLTRDDITGGTFTVSNLGMFGLDRFDAIINPPQVAILAIGAARDAVVVSNGQPAAGKVMTLTLSCDHRVVDGAVGAAFLRTLRELIESAQAL
jgi:pyruvate dehydrogenase E2 component (dihydrolipoamide acetyltransferase)